MTVLLDAAGLEAACRAMCKPSGLSAWQNNMPYAEAAVAAYLAAIGRADLCRAVADEIEASQPTS